MAQPSSEFQVYIVSTTVLRPNKKVGTKFKSILFWTGLKAFTFWESILFLANDWLVWLSRSASAGASR